MSDSTRQFERDRLFKKWGQFKLMQEKPSIIKRPIVDLGKRQLIGFDVGEYEDAFGTGS